MSWSHYPRPSAGWAMFWFCKHCLRQTTLLDQTPKAEADQYMCQFCGKQAEKELGEGPLAPMGPITLGQFNGI